MIKKVISRISLIFNEAISLLRDGWSISYITWNIIWWLSWSMKLMSLNNKATAKKAKQIEKYIEKKYSYIIEKYRTAEESMVECQDFKIWVFWGQGIENMPKLVKRCYEQLTKYNNGSVHFIDMNNVRNYVELPEIVYEKLNSGKLLHAHFSDIVRNSLLAEYGGLWLDATVYTAGQIPEIAKHSTFFSPHDKDAGTYWCTYAIGSNKLNSVTFSFVRDLLIKTCAENRSWPDYLYQDYLFGIAQKHLPATKAAMDATPQNNTRRFMLFALMNKPYNEKEYSELIADNFIFKLSYKANYRLECNGEKTYYSKLIANKQ